MRNASTFSTDEPGERTTPLPTSIEDWSELSQRGKVIATWVAMPLSQGHSVASLARELGRSRSWITERLEELRLELEELARRRER
jgi:hypothetical protein